MMLSQRERFLVNLDKECMVLSQLIPMIALSFSVWVGLEIAKLKKELGVEI